jgi:hypothetical protein
MVEKLSACALPGHPLAEEESRHYLTIKSFSQKWFPLLWDLIGGS